MRWKAVILILAFTAPTTAGASDCGDIAGIMSDMIHDPVGRKGKPLDGKRIQSQSRLNGAYACLYVEDEYQYEVSCIWFAQSYEDGSELFSQIRGIVKSCSFVTGERYLLFNADGHQLDFFGISSKLDQKKQLGLQLSHHPAFTFSDPNLGLREVEMSISRSKN